MVVQSGILIAIITLIIFTEIIIKIYDSLEMTMDFIEILQLPEIFAQFPKEKDKSTVQKYL